MGQCNCTAKTNNSDKLSSSIKAKHVPKPKNETDLTTFTDTTQQSHGDTDEAPSKGVLVTSSISTGTTSIAIAQSSSSTITAVKSEAPGASTGTTSTAIAQSSSSTITAVISEASGASSALPDKETNSEQGATIDKDNKTANEEEHEQKTANVEEHEQKTANVEEHVQKTANVGEHVQKRENVEEHEQKTANVEEHVQKTANVEEHVQKTANVGEHVQKRENVEEHIQEIHGPWKEKLLRCYKRFVQDAHPDTIIDDCYTEGILTHDEKDKLLTYQTPSEKNRYFLKILLHKSEDTYKRFLECLTENPHIKKLILETDATKSLRREEEKHAMQLRRKIFCNMQCIVDGPDLKNLLDDFVSERVFEIDDLEKISNAHLTTKEQNTTFLNVLLSKKMLNGYHLLMSELSQTHPDLVEKIMTTTVTEVVDKDIVAHLRILESQKKGVKLTQEEIERIQMDLHEEEIGPRKLEDWRKSDNTFYPTIATAQICEKIQSKKKVVAFGLPGSGKTAAIRHIALRLKNEGHRLCCVQTFNELKCKMDKFREKERQVYVIDDVFGVHGVDELKRKQWCDDNKDEVERCLNNPNISILCSSRMQVLNDDTLNTIKSRFTIVNISEGECELSKDERAGMFRNHAITKQRNDLLTDNKDKLKDDIKEKVREVECPVGCFPLVCHLYTGDTEPKQTIDEYFNKPLNVIADHLEKLRVEDRLSHFCLLLCLIYENKLPVNTMKVGKEEEETKNPASTTLLSSIKNKLLPRFAKRDGDTYQQTKKKREELLEICKLPLSTPRTEIGDRMDTLLQTFVKREGDEYQFVHDIVHDAVIKHVGGLKSDVLEVILRHCKVLLCAACNRRCDADVVQALIDAGADVNTQDVNGDTALSRSAWHGDYKTTQLLLDHKADVNLCDKVHGASALYRSVYKGHYKTTQLLLDHGADVNLCTNQGMSALYLSVDNGDYKTTQLLLDHRADVNLCNSQGWSALYLSVYEGDYKTTQLLLDHKADVNLCDKVHGASALYRSVYKGHYKTTQLLLDHGADVNLCTNKGWSALNRSVDNGDYKTTQLLLNHKADVNLCDIQGWSALYRSVVKGDYKTTQLLLDHKADVNLCDKPWGSSALFRSQFMKHENITSLLLSHGAVCRYDGKKYKTITDIPDKVVNVGDWATVRGESVFVKKRIQELKEKRKVTK